jgi:hypothetical protein
MEKFCRILPCLSRSEENPTHMSEEVKRRAPHEHISSSREDPVG